MKQQKTAPHPSEKRQSTKKNLYFNHSTSLPKNQYSQKSKKRYPHSAYSIKLSKHCPYCNYGTGLVVIRYKDDLGFCRCGRCDSALFSLKDESQKQGLEHIGAILDKFLPTSTASDEEVGK